MIAITYGNVVDDDVIIELDGVAWHDDTCQVCLLLNPFVCNEYATSIKNEKCDVIAF